MRQRSLCFGALTVHPEEFQASVAGQPVGLAYQEFCLLAMLARRANHVVSYSEVEMALWQRQDESLKNRMRVLVFRLRAKLGAAAPVRIEAVRKVGYRLVAPARAA